MISVIFWTLHTQCSGICTADVPSTRLGKIQGSELPQEYKLDLFVRGIKNLNPTWNTNTPACEWHGVWCNEEGEVGAIDWKGCNLQGTFFWEHLPKSVLILDLSRHELCGLVEFELFPPKLETLRLSSNKFTGSIKNLPVFMQVISVDDNCFTGELNFGLLPASLRFLDVSHNELSGTPQFGDIKSNLRRIYLRNNFFEGEVDFQRLPGTVIWLTLDGNRDLSGMIDLSTHSPALRHCFTDQEFCSRTKIHLLH